MTIKLTIAENSVKDPDLVADEKLSLQERMEDMDSGENVPAENCLKGRNMLVVMANGDEASGRWMKGRREGAGCHIGPRLEKIGVHQHGQFERQSL